MNHTIVGIEYSFITQFSIENTGLIKKVESTTSRNEKNHEKLKWIEKKENIYALVITDDINTLKN